MKIAIADAGYVGLSNGLLLAQHNKVVVLDIIPEKVKMLQKKISSIPIEDKELDKFKKKSKIIVANRLKDDILDVKDNVYTRDLF